MTRKKKKTKEATQKTPDRFSVSGPVSMDYKSDT